MEDNFYIEISAGIACAVIFFLLFQLYSNNFPEIKGGLNQPAQHSKYIVVPEKIKIPNKINNL